MLRDRVTDDYYAEAAQDGPRAKSDKTKKEWWAGGVEQNSVIFIRAAFGLVF